MGSKRNESHPSPIVHFNTNSDIVNLLQETIKSGSSLYNKNYKELCISIYWSTINTIVAAASSQQQQQKDLSSSSFVSSSSSLLTKSMSSSISNSNNNNGDDIMETNPTIKYVACAGLRRSMFVARQQNLSKDGKKVNLAWTLRHTMDAIISDILGTNRKNQNDWLPSRLDIESALLMAAENNTSSSNNNYPI